MISRSLYKHGSWRKTRNKALINWFDTSLLRESGEHNYQWATYFVCFSMMVMTLDGNIEGNRRLPLTFLLVVEISDGHYRVRDSIWQRLASRSIIKIQNYDQWSCLPCSFIFCVSIKTRILKIGRKLWPQRDFYWSQTIFFASNCRQVTYLYSILITVL